MFPGLQAPDGGADALLDLGFEASSDVGYLERLARAGRGSVMYDRTFGDALGDVWDAAYYGDPSSRIDGLQGVGRMAMALAGGAAGSIKNTWNAIAADPVGVASDILNAPLLWTYDAIEGSAYTLTGGFLGDRYAAMRNTQRVEAFFGTFGSFMDAARAGDMEAGGDILGPLLLAPLRLGRAGSVRGGLGVPNAEVKAFSSGGAFDGALYPQEKLQQLVRYLERRNVSVYGTHGNPAFQARADGSGIMYLPENPTALQVKHELSHYLDFKRLGFEAYRDLGRTAREAYVLERLQGNRVWHQLNEAEQRFSIEYVERLRKAERAGNGR